MAGPIMNPQIMQWLKQKAQQGAPGAQSAGSRPYVAPRYAPDAAQMLGPYPQAETRPAVEVQVNRPTGVESAPTAYGNIALQFLQGFQKARSQAAEQEINNKTRAINSMERELNAVLSDPDIASDDKETAKKIYAQQIQGVFQEHAGKSTKKHPVLGFLGSILDSAAGGPMEKGNEVNPAMFHEAINELRANAVKIPQRIANAEKPMFDRLAELKKENPFLTRGQALMDKKFLEGYQQLSGMVRDKNPLDDEKWGFFADPKTAEEADNRSWFIADQKRKEAAQAAAQAAAQQQAATAQTAQLDPAQAQMLGPAMVQAQQSAQQAVQPQQATPPPPAARTAAPVAVPATAPPPGQSNVLLRNVSTPVVYQATDPDLAFNLQRPGMKREEVLFWKADGTQVPLLKITDKRGLADGYYDVTDTSNPRKVDIQGSRLLTTKPDKSTLTVEGAGARLQSAQNRILSYVNNKTMAMEEAQTLNKDIQGLINTNQPEAADRLVDQVLSRIDKAQDRIASAKNAATMASATRSAQRDLKEVQLAMSTAGRFASSQVARRADEALSAYVNAKGMVQKLAQDPKLADTAIYDKQLVIGAQTITTSGSVQIGEVKNWTGATQNIAQEFAVKLQNIIDGKAVQLTPADRILMAKYIKNGAEQSTKQLFREAGAQIKGAKALGFDIPIESMSGVSRAAEEFPAMFKAEFGGSGEPTKNSAPPPAAAQPSSGAIKNRREFKPTTPNAPPPQSASPAKGARQPGYEDRF